MRIIPPLVLLLGALSPMVNSSPLQTFSTNAVLSIARSSYKRFLNKIPPGYESRYGFVHRDEFTRTTVGKPLRVYTAYPDSRKEETGIPVKWPYLLNEWRVPLLVDGEFRSLLTIVETDGVLKAVDLGAAKLAREIGTFNRNNPDGSKALFRLDRLKCDFILIKKSNAPIQEDAYYPLHSARRLLNTTDTSFFSRVELFGEIHRRSRETLQTDR